MEVISVGYLEQQKELHENPNYGVASLAFASFVAKIAKENKIRSICDYGAGKKRLLQGLKSAGLSGFRYLPYDPAFPEYGEPEAAEMVCCIDVLEHVEPNYVAPTISVLAGLTQKVGFFSIHMGPAGKTLSDGRNAHLIQQPTSWWLPRLCENYEIKSLQQHNLYGKGFWVIVTPKA